MSPLPPSETPAEASAAEPPVAETPAHVLVPDPPAAESSIPPAAKPDKTEGVGARLLARRVPQILGLYVGAATSAVLFADFLEKRYALSPYLTDVLLVAAVLAVPAVAVLAYAHGAPGAQRWTRRQVGALALNGALGAAVLGAAFWGKPLGATTDTVTVETEDGTTVERTVARAAFRKRVAVADFAGDEALGRAAGYAVAAVLQQDLFVTAGRAGSFRRVLREAGFETTASAPLALLRDGAARGQFDHFITGRTERTGAGVRVEATLHRTDSPRDAETFTAEGPAFPAVLDEVAGRIRGALGLPETHLATADALPVADLLSGSEPALVSWAEGRHASAFAEDAGQALTAFDAAVGHDSTFAIAHASRGAALRSFARGPEALAAFHAARRHRYRLPEADRFYLEVEIAQAEQRPADALATAQEWATLHPDDTRAQETLLLLHLQRDAPDEALAAAEQLVEIDAGNPIRLYWLAQIHLRENRYPEARDALDRYVEAVPEDPAGPSLLAGILWQLGDLDGALERAEQAVRLAPTDIRYRQIVGSYHRSRGEWAEAERTVRAAFRQATEPGDQAGALNEIAHIYDAQGRYREAAAALDSVFEIRAGIRTPAQVLSQRVGEGYHYVRAGRATEFERDVAAALANPEIASTPAFRADVLTRAAWGVSQTGASAEVLRYTALADSLYRSVGEDARLPYVRAVRGVGHANAGRWNRAIADLAPYAEEAPTDHYRLIHLVEAHARSGDRDAARETAKLILTSYPGHPVANLWMAKLARRPADRRRHLDTALAAWTQADDRFEPVAEARALRRQLAR